MSSQHSATHQTEDSAKDPSVEDENGASSMEGSFMVVDSASGLGAQSIHQHVGSTNGWAPERSVEGRHAWSPGSSGSEDFRQLPAAQITKIPTPASSINFGGSDDDAPNLAQSASLEANAATSQWGEEADAEAKVPASPGPAGARTPPAEFSKENAPRSPKLVSSFGSTKFCTSSNPPRSACTKVEKSAASDLVQYDSDWMWFAVGAAAVVGAMFAGQQIYRYVRVGKNHSTAQSA